MRGDGERVGEEEERLEKKLSMEDRFFSCHPDKTRTLSRELVSSSATLPRS